jgi:hypothetical protein
MGTKVKNETQANPWSKLPWATHSWLEQVKVAYLPGPKTPLLQKFVFDLKECFQNHDHSWQDGPDDQTHVLITTATFGEAVNWRDSLLFTSRRRFNLNHQPITITLLHASPEELQFYLSTLGKALRKETADPMDYQYPGLAPQAYHTLHEQGRRGGPILALVRLLQAQTKSIRIILIVGKQQPEEAYTFDLVGAHPRSDAALGDQFYKDIMYRIVTAASTYEVTAHRVEEEIIPAKFWDGLSTPGAMITAGKELGRRNFFTEMVVVSNLAKVPAIHEAIASQYSEGCFATWDPVLKALMVTVTGSARPVEKDNLTEDDLAVITRVRGRRIGACVRHVEGKVNDPPSSEAVELLEMDSGLPRIRLGSEWEIEAEVPVVRSKLHGHRGVLSYCPEHVEHVFLDPPYYHYPVSCSTEAQARAIKAAFSRAQALQTPDNQRQVIFTVLPGHGVVIVEKWVPGKAPFQVIWEYMDAGFLVLDKLIPQGPLTFVPAGDGKMRLLAQD